MINRDAPTAADEALEYLEQAAGTLQDLHGDMEHVHRLATLGTLAASIAHEINNILTPVLGYAQLAKSDPGDADLQAKALDRAIAGVEAASTIAAAILRFGQPRGRPEATTWRASVTLSKSLMRELRFDHAPEPPRSPRLK